MVDGKVLRDPNNNGPVKKIGKNLFFGEQSGYQFKMDDGNIDFLKKILNIRPSGLHELRDPNNGLPLFEIEEGVFESPMNSIFVVTIQEKLETAEFNEKLAEIYKNGQNKDIKLLIDGEELKEPSCGGEVKKIGPNLYEGVLTGNRYFIQDGKLLEMKEPIAGTKLELQEDGRYYSDTLDKYFTLEQAQNGETKFFPTYLPYDGMTDISAKRIGDRLVGENGISFPILENGWIDLPMDDNLRTQEEIDENIQEKHIINENSIREMNEQMEKFYASAKDELNFKIRVIELATEIAVARTYRETTIDMYKECGMPIDLKMLPRIPKIPDDIPPELVEAEVKNIIESVADFEKDIGNLSFQNVAQLSENASFNKGMSKAIDGVKEGLKTTLNPERNKDDENNKENKEDEELELN